MDSNRKRLIALSAAACTALILSCVSVDRKGEESMPVFRPSVSLNGNWKFKLLPKGAEGPTDAFYEPAFDDSAWDDISVPSNWDAVGFEEPRYKRPTESVGLYRRAFDVPAEWQGKRVFIRFEGILFGYEFWVNGARAGSWESAFNPCQFDVTPHVKPGQPNVVAVRVYKRFKGYDFDTHDAWALSGIYRDVSLFAVHETHIEDLTVTTALNGERSEASVNLDIALTRPEGTELPPGLRLAARLTDEKGKKLFSTDAPVTSAKATQVLSVPQPRLWTAETPHLYDLSVELRRGREVLDALHERVGIRQVSVEDGVLKVNGTAVKLRGVCRHEIHPAVGRALRYEHWRRDVELMKAAHVNFVRTAHYPPDERFIELCDEHGLYVMCEVPFGFGDSHLGDPSYQGILMTRAEATVRRDKNHPSVIIWSVGNENPFTKIVGKVVQRVKELDPTRPVCLPQTGGYFISMHASLPDYVDVFSPHYPTPAQMELLARTCKRPVIFTEYRHALALSFEGLPACWGLIEEHPVLAGGAIWLWADQGLYRKAQKMKPSEHPDDVWVDENTYIDCARSSGTDGIVYADRTPQVDYWETRKVYCPIVVREKEVTASAGAQKLTLTLESKYDFVDFADLGLSCQWQLFEDAKCLQKATVPMQLAPHGARELSIDVSIPGSPALRDYRLALSFSDGEGRSVHEHAVRLLPESGKLDLAARLDELKPDASIRLQHAADATRVLHSDFTLSVAKSGGLITIGTPSGETPLVSGFFARVGRYPNMAERRQYRGRGATWMPFVLKEPASPPPVMQQQEGGLSVRIRPRYERVELKGQAIEGEIVIGVSTRGWTDVSYDLAPSNGKGVLLEAGVSFLLPAGLTEFRWLGDGPYASYPGKSELAERGIHRICADDVYFPGNRANVNLVVMTDKAGRGIGMVCESANVAWEKYEGGILVSHNAVVSGRGTKFHKTATEYAAAKVRKLSGSFRVMPVAPDSWPTLFADVFGDARPEDYRVVNPFLVGYD